MSPLEGKVAAILNEREIAINLGKTAGVEPDMKFAVLWEKEVKDPDTGEVLGNAAGEKIRVKAVSVQDKITIARTYEIVSGLRIPIPLLFEMERVRTLKYDPRYAFGDLDESQSYVKVGDNVRQIVEEWEEQQPDKQGEP